MTIYDEFIFSIKDDIYLLGMGSDSNRYPYGIYHYKLSNRDPVVLFFSPYKPPDNKFIKIAEAV